MFPHFPDTISSPILTQAWFVFLSPFFLILPAYPKRTQPGLLTHLSLKPLFAEPRRERGRRADDYFILPPWCALNPKQEANWSTPGQRFQGARLSQTGILDGRFKEIANGGRDCRTSSYRGSDIDRGLAFILDVKCPPGQSKSWIKTYPLASYFHASQ